MSARILITNKTMKNRYRIYINRKHSGGKVWWIQDN